jgi:hypothetical protein
MEDNTPKKSITYNAVNKIVKKQLIQKHIKEKNKKRVESENWSFNPEHYMYTNQMNMIKDILANNYNHNDDVSKIAMQQINRKIYGYKQQDIIKKLFNEKEFITFESIINKMIDCELKCYYCSCEMNVLYDISREMTQWTVDRIDNDFGHNLTNYYLACLECNLKRRRRSDDKFLFTKQMKLVKLPGENNEEKKENEGKQDNDASLV